MDNLEVVAQPATETKVAVDISQAELLRAATNDPALSPDQFKLGDKVYKVVDLEYDDYLSFLSLLQPLIEPFLDKLISSAKKNSDDIPVANVSKDKLNVGTIMTYCGTNLPEMALIVCRQTNPSITVPELKRLAKNPLKLAPIVLMQIQRNNVIQDFMDFFAQVLPMLSKK